MTSLPIKKRGNFFKDEYFDEFHNDFENAVDKVMDKQGGKCLLAEQFTNSRKLKRENSEVAGAASISDTGDNYIIVLDMSDFLSGSITVSTSGKNAVVAANFENNKFYKKFPLPSNCNIDGVKSAMSDEGILTINAPKKGAKRVLVSTTENIPDKMAEASLSQKMEDEAAPNAEKGKITVECINLSRKMDDNPSQSVPQTPTETRRVSIDRRGNFFQDSKFENVWSDFEKSMEDMIQTEKSKLSERDVAKAKRRAHIDAVIDNITKDFFGNVSPREKTNFFENDSKKYKDKLFDSDRKKQRSFDDDLSSLRETFFGEDRPKRRDPFFDDFAKKKDNFFGGDFRKKKDSFFDDSEKLDKFFGDNSARKDQIFADGSRRERYGSFKDSSSKRRDNLFEDDSITKDYLKDHSTKRREKFFREDTKDFFAPDATKCGRFKKYRNLRNWNPAAETQAVSVKQSSDSYKILLDAKGVDSNSISVQAKDDGLLVSGGEGRTAFKRKFSLPGAISFDKVNASLSEDGVLLITIPKN